MYIIHQGTLRLFPHPAVVNNAAINTGATYLSKLAFTYSLDKYPEVELLDYTAVPCLAINFRAIEMKIRVPSICLCQVCIYPSFRNKAVFVWMSLRKMTELVLGIC